MANKSRMTYGRKNKISMFRRRIGTSTNTLQHIESILSTLNLRYLIASLYRLLCLCVLGIKIEFATAIQMHTKLSNDNIYKWFPTYSNGKLWMRNYSTMFFFCRSESCIEHYKGHTHVRTERQKKSEVEEHWMNKRSRKKSEGEYVWITYRWISHVYLHV